MNILSYSFLVLVFLICFIRLEFYFFQKSKERFIDLKKAYKEFKEAERDIKIFLGNDVSDCNTKR